MKKIFLSMLVVFAVLSLFAASESKPAGRKTTKTTKIQATELNSQTSDIWEENTDSKDNFSEVTVSAQQDDKKRKKKNVSPVNEPPIVSEKPVEPEKPVDSPKKEEPEKKENSPKPDDSSKTAEPEKDGIWGSGILNWMILSFSILGMLFAGGGVYLIFDAVKKINENIKDTFICRDKAYKDAKTAHDNSKKDKETIENLSTELENEERNNKTLRATISKLEQNVADKEREKTKALEEKQRECDKALEEKQRECDKALEEKQRECDDLKKKFDTCEYELSDCQEKLGNEEKKVLDLNKQINAFIDCVGQNIFDIMDGLPMEKDMQIVMLGLSKLKALKDFGVEELKLLEEFRSLDSQIARTIKNTDDLQKFRENEKFLEFVRECLPSYKIDWPRIGANTSDYQKNMLEIDEDAVGTTIAHVKCAAISFTDDENPFQKAMIECK